MASASGEFPGDLCSQEWRGNVLWIGYANTRQHYKGSDEEMRVHFVIHGSPNGPYPTLLEFAIRFIGEVDPYRLSASAATESVDGELHLRTAEFFDDHYPRVMLELTGYGKRPSTPGPPPVLLEFWEFECGEPNRPSLPSIETRQRIWCGHEHFGNA